MCDSVAGTFRRISVTAETTFTSKDHGPIAGNEKSMPIHTIKKAVAELNEVEAVKISAVKELREMIETRLSEAVDSEEKEELQAVKSRFSKEPDSVYVKFLRARKYDVERSCHLMQGYMRYRIRYPDVISGVRPNEVRKWVEKGQPGVIPSRDAKGRVVMFFRLDNWDPVEYPFSEVMKSYVYVLEKLLESNETQVNGICLVEDFSGYTMSQVSAVGINDYKKMIDMLQDSFPCRFKGVHCIRQPWYFATAYNVVRPFLKAKIFSRIHVCGENLEAYLNEFTKEFLPEELGGEGKPYDGVEAAERIFGPINEDNEDTAL